MELLTGGTLADQRAQGGLTLPGAVAAVMAAASGLHHVHEHGVLHRDVKPENLMFDGRGVLKVTDFGIARGDGDPAVALNVTRADEFTGTPAYIAPEQAAPFFGGGWPAVGPAADQYSLAAVLYEILSGALTHDASSGWVTLCAARMGEEAMPLGRRVSQLPAPLEQVVMQALRRDPSERFPSVEAFAVALGHAMGSAYGEEWYASSSVAIREPGVIRDAAGAPPPTVVEHHPNRRLPVMVLMAVVAAVLAAGLTWFLGRNDGSATSPTPPNSVAPAALRLRLTKAWSFATGGNVFASPRLAGKTVVIGSEDGTIYGIDANTGARVWSNSTGDPVQASAAIVGETAYVAGLDGNVYALDTTDGSVRWKHPLGFEVVSSPVVADGLVVVGANGVDALDAATGELRWHQDTGDVVVSSPAISGSTVVVGSNDGSVYGLSVADGTRRWKVETGGKVESSPRVEQGIAYIGSLDGSVRAIDAETGQKVWTIPLDSPVKSSPTVVNGLVLVGTDDGRLVGLRVRDGTTKWTFRATRSVDSSPTSSSGLAVVGSTDGSVYVVDAASGVIQGRFDTGGPVLSSPIVDGTTIIVGSHDDHVYAIRGLR